jgi:hypothetical protein
LFVGVVSVAVVAAAIIRSRAVGRGGKTDGRKDAGCLLFNIFYRDNDVGIYLLIVMESFLDER